MRPRLLATPLILLALLLAAAPALAASAKVTGSPAVGSTLTASLKGGAIKSVRWQRCATAPSGVTCAAPKAAGSGKTHVVAAAEAGMWLRAVVQPKGKGHAAASAWVGPAAAATGGAATPTTTSGGLGGGSALAGAPSGGLTGQPAIDRFTQLLIGGVMTRVTANSNLGTQTNTRISWCQGGGSFFYHFESIGNYSALSEDATATYTVTQAAFNAAGTLAEGVVRYSATPANTSAGPGGDVVVRLGSGIAWIGSLDNEYQWVSGSAGC